VYLRYYRFIFAVLQVWHFVVYLRYTLVYLTYKIQYLGATNSARI
jgi:hypothetical protein